MTAYPMAVQPRGSDSSRQVLTWECIMPLKRCLQVYSSYMRMAKLYTSEAGVTFPSFRTCAQRFDMSSAMIRSEWLFLLHVLAALTSRMKWRVVGQ